MPSVSISTEREIAALKANIKVYEVSVSHARGLRMRVLPSGLKRFELRYIAENGARRRLTLGTFPSLSLADARRESVGVRAQVEKGSDPQDQRSLARKEARSKRDQDLEPLTGQGTTFAELTEIYFEAAKKGLHGGKGRPKAASTLAAERTRLNGRVLPLLGPRRFDEIKKRQLQVLLHDLAAEGHLSGDSLADIRKGLVAIFGFAEHSGRLDASPAIGLKLPLAKQTRDRMFSEEAMRKIWHTLIEATEIGTSRRYLVRRRGADDAANNERLKSIRVDPVVSYALQLAILTLCRRAEAALARWDEVDFKNRVWTIPASRTKNRRVHSVPLSDAALSLLMAIRGHFPTSAYVFPSPSIENKPIVATALTQALTRMLKELGLPQGSPHDFRRTGATKLTSEQFGVRRFIVGRVLGHTDDEGARVTSIYDRNEYMSDKRGALNAWAEYVVRL